MLPNLSLLEQINQKIKTIPNHCKESKRKEHYCLFLLGYKAGLRVSEAIKFDLSSKTRKGLYQIKTKGKKERLVAIPKQVISELKANNWKPNQTNRFNFYHFLKRIKRDMLMKQLGISKEVELTPHTLRRAFATYHAENGLPLPLLQKLLGHSSIRTTALYWRNIYNSDDDDASDILTAKNWLDTNARQKPKKPPLETKNPINLNLGKLPELPIPNSLASKPRPDYLNKVQQLEQQLSQIQQENSSSKEQNKDLKQDLNNLDERNTDLQYTKNQAQKDLTIATVTIQQLTKKLTNEREQRVITENDLAQEKQTSHNLQKQFQALQAINTNLNQRINQSEQNHANLLNTYQITLKDKAKFETLVQSQKQRADYYESQLKTIAKSIYQWQKTNHYQQLEQEQKCSIVQAERPPPWKSK